MLGIVDNQTGVNLFFTTKKCIPSGEKHQFGRKSPESRLTTEVHLIREDGKGSLMIIDYRTTREIKTLGDIYYTLGPEMDGENRPVIHVHGRTQE